MTAGTATRACRGLACALALVLLGSGCAVGTSGRLAATGGGPRPVCGHASRPDLEAAAARNGASLYTTPIDLFGRPETGWAIYAPMIGRQVESSCPADTPGFAEAVARWSLAHGVAADGAVTPDLLMQLKSDWQDRRPFVRLRAQGVCPDPPPPDELETVPAELTYGDRPLELRRDALAAWARLVRDARMAPELAGDAERLRIFSAVRSPAYYDARCSQENNCQGVVRAACSAHRTGLALDVVLDAAPGFAVDSSADANRLAMTRGPAYRWLVANAGRYGFVNYAFEPWHWEWTGARF
ncbi:MAG: D-alanyl-D-alanine carboxypeptidase family protein [Caulobacteraceae bacterium]